MGPGSPNNQGGQSQGGHPGDRRADHRKGSFLCAYAGGNEEGSGADELGQRLDDPGIGKGNGVSEQIHFNKLIGLKTGNYSRKQICPLYLFNLAVDGLMLLMRQNPFRRFAQGRIAAGARYL